MDSKRLTFSTQGRVPRRKYWGEKTTGEKGKKKKVQYLDSIIINIIELYVVSKR